MHLYEITADYRQALATLEDMDLPPEVVADTIEGLAGALEEKGRNVAAFMQHLEADAKAMLDAESRIAARRKAVEARAAWLREYLHRNMVAADITEISCPEFVLRIRQNPVKVVVDDADSIPADYQVEIPATTRLDKKLVKSAIEDGYDVPGAHLERGTRLDIK